MKFLKAFLPAVLAVVMCMFCLTACGGSGVEGTYKFDSMKATVNGEVVQEGKVGDEVQVGPDTFETLTEDYMVIELKKDGVLTGKSAESDEDMTGTWAAGDADNEYVLTMGDETVTAVIKDGTMTITATGEGYSSTTVLKKK